MKRAALQVGKGFFGLIGCLAYLGTGLIAFAIHLYTTWYAYESAGFLPAVLTFIFPVVSEIFWAFPIASAAGSWWNMYTASIILLFAGYVIMHISIHFSELGKS
jgi:hypothetical protein